MTLNGLSDGIDKPTTASAKCIGCHSVGGLSYVVNPADKAAVHGPDLRRVHERLRPDWLRLWLQNPKWITPYTSMPINFQPSSKGAFETLLGGDPEQQAIGAADALLNYARLLEAHGVAVRGKSPCLLYTSPSPRDS